MIRCLRIGGVPVRPHEIFAWAASLVLESGCVAGSEPLIRLGALYQPKSSQAEDDGRGHGGRDGQSPCPQG